MADGFSELNVEQLSSPDGVNQINRMLRTIYENIAGDTEGVRVFNGYGSPEGVVSAGIGSIYMRLDGGTNTSIYHKETGTSNTGWIASTNPTLPLSVANGGFGADNSAQTKGKIIYVSATGVISFLATGTSGQVLKSQGALSDPAWGNQSFSLVSATTITNVTNSGDITIDNTKHYKVRAKLNFTGTTDDNIGIRLNNDSDADTEYVYQGVNSAGTTRNGNATNGTSLITGATADAQTYSNEQIVIEFNIYPQGSDSTPQVTYTYIEGSIAYIDSAAQLFVKGTFGGRKSVATGTAVTSFRLISIGGNNFSGNVYLYEMAQS